MNYEDWVTYTEGQKLDILRQEVQRLGVLVQYGVAAAGAVGALLGSLATVAIQHFLK